MGYDFRTEILTQQGWKLSTEINKYDLLATIVDNSLAFVMPSMIKHYDYDGKVLEVKGDLINLVVSEDHNLYVKLQRPSDEEPQFVFIKPKQFETLDPNTTIAMAKAISYTEPTDDELDPDLIEKIMLCRLTGLVFLFGSSFEENEIRMNPAKIDEYGEFLQKICNHLKVSLDLTGEEPVIYAEPSIIWLMPFVESIVNDQRAFQKIIPSWLFSFDYHSKREFLVTILRFTSEGENLAIDEESANRLQTLGIQCGIPLRIGLSEDSTVGMRRLSVQDNGEEFKIKDFKISYYTGKMFCATVHPSHLLVVRRNGQVVVSGNFFSDDTEVFTEAGWKGIDTFSLKDKVACADPLTKHWSFTKVDLMHNRTYKGQMYYAVNDNVDFKVTLDHILFSHNKKTHPDLHKYQSFYLYFQGSEIGFDRIKFGNTTLYDGTGEMGLFVKTYAYLIKNAFVFNNDIYVNLTEDLFKVEKYDHKLGRLTDLDWLNFLLFKDEVCIDNKIVHLNPHLELISTWRINDFLAFLVDKFFKCPSTLADQIQYLSVQNGGNIVIKDQGVFFRNNTDINNSNIDDAIIHYEGEIFGLTPSISGLICTRRNGKILWSYGDS